jgi:hypothetical protein
MRIKHVAPVIVKRYLNAAVRKRALFLKGKPGVGKSDAVFQASELLKGLVDNWQGVVDMRLSQMSPEDLKGIPAADMATKLATWCRFDTLPTGGSGIIFLDELNAAPPSIQAAAYQLVLTPQDFDIPAEWMLIAAGNSKSDRGVVHSIGAPLQNRFCELEVDTTLEDVLEYMAIMGKRPEVMSFLRDRPDFVHKADFPDGIVRPFPSPRSWFATSDALSLDLPEEIRPEVLAGDIGEEAGISFEAHLRIYGEMPRIDDILEGKPVEMPDKLNVLYCVAMGLAMRLDKDNFAPAWKFLEQAPSEIQTLTVKLAYKRDKAISKSPAYAKWAINNQQAFSYT